MKIVYVVPYLNLRGGIQQLARTTAESLDEDFKVSLINYEFEPFRKIERFLNYFPDKIAGFLFLNFFSFYYRHFYKLKEHELIHFWNIEAAMAFTHEDYVLTCHGLEILKKNILKYKVPIYELVLKNAKWISADSEYSKRLLLENFEVDPNKIVVINPGIDVKRFSKKHIRSNKLVIGTLSRLVDRKNHLNIIQGLEIYKKKYNNNFTYYFAGTGLEEEKIFKLLKECTFEWKYFGDISEEEKVNTFYPSLDIFVLPTLELKHSIEGFGIVYLEANSAGIPVIASSVGGVPDAVKDGYSGLFCDPTSPKDVAAKIYELNTNKNKFQKNLKSWVKKFEFKTIAKQFQSIYTTNG